MNVTRREMLGLVAAGAVAGCSGGERTGDSGGATGDSPGGDGLGGDSGDTAGTSLAGSCASNFGDTLTRYDPGARGTIATFGYPMGGTITAEQDESDGYVTAIGYGRGDISPMHGMTVSEFGPFTDTGDATEVYGWSDEYDTDNVTTWGGQTRPAAVLRRDESVTFLVRVDGPDGFYEFAAGAGAGEGEPCPETYESIARRVVESFEPVA
jgi:hypothetical protein